MKTISWMIAAALFLAAPAWGDNPAAEKAARTGGYQQEDYPYSKKEKFERRMERTIRNMDKKIETLRFKASRGVEISKEAAAEGLDELEMKREAAKTKLAELKGATKENWEDVKDATRTAVDELEDAYRRTVSRFKND